MAETLQVRDYTTILGHNKDGKPITLADFRGQYTSGLKGEMVAVTSDGVPFDPDTWGRSSSDIASQQGLMASLGVTVDDETEG